MDQFGGNFVAAERQEQLQMESLLLEVQTWKWLLEWLGM